ncbi:DUF4249 family protein [Pontibacter sp. G13]|uniref:DUF4249 family protein n=1 Tax=Pontibacter sp. G13 TaxID=3074898 RepID=UPI0028894CC9|nr:DUF4249 family protein [Pontibacter sp. G13]WNJ18452.1 DUF4249 family protein [Pontibacter sp. G13]
MKTRFSQTALLFLSLFSCWRCANVSQIPFPETAPQLVVNCVFSPDSTWKVNVSQTRGLGDFSYEPHYIEHARVILWEADSLLDTLSYDRNGNYLFSQKPISGVVYRIRVEATGYDPVEASDMIPEQVPVIENLVWDQSRKVTLGDEMGGVYSSFPINFELVDSGRSINRYLLQLTQIDSCDCLDHPYRPHLNRKTDGWTTYGLDHRVPVAESAGKKHGRLMFTSEALLTDRTAMEAYSDTGYLFYVHHIPETGMDTLWRGNTSAWGEYNAPRKQYVRTYLDAWNMSDALYRYHLSYWTQSYAAGDPFAYHINAYSNTTNQLGIFAGYQRKWFLMYAHG